MPRTVGGMIKFLNAEGIEVKLEGDTEFIPQGISNLEQAKNGDLTFYTGEDREKTQHLVGCVLICKPDLSPLPDSIIKIKTEHPKLSFIILAQEFAPPPPKSGIHPTVILHSEAKVHPTASIGPYCYLEKCVIAEDVIISANVTVYTNSRIGRGTIIESNTCIGPTGQGFEWGLNGKRWVMPQIGGTVIGENCFIGSLVSIVRGAMQDTIIENGCRIAHGTKIGHNCHIGEDTFIANGIAMAGSTIIGKKCYLGSGSTYKNKVRLGNNITVGVGAAVVSDYLEDGLVLVGVPAKPLKSSR